MINNYSNHWYNQHTKSHKLKPVLAYLNKLLPSTCNWFIAGGAVVNPKSFNDIDIYFTDKNSFRQAALAFGTIKPPSSNTPNAYTFEEINVDSGIILGLFDAMPKYTFQLVQKQFTSIHDTLKNFDLSCSKLAILPNGEVLAHHDYSNLIRICNLNAHTLSRVLKYHYNKGFKLDDEAFITTLANLHTIRNQKLIDYYQGEKELVIIKQYLLIGSIDPIFYNPCVTYIDTLPARVRTLIYSRIFNNPGSWNYNDTEVNLHEESRSLEFLRSYSRCVNRIPAMLNLFPEDYL